VGRLHTINEKTIITVYSNDHLPPHFHIVNPNFEALVIIETFAFYAGSVKGNVGKAALNWARNNVAAIRAEWNRVNPRFPVD
jgi:hypothetical protein